MNVERELERFVENIGEPEPPRDAHRRELRQQVVAAAQAAGRLGLVSQTNRWRSIMNSSLIRWSATAALVLVGVALVGVYAIHTPSTAWADVQKTLEQAQTLSLKIAVHQGEELRRRMTVLFLHPHQMRVEVQDQNVVGIVDLSQGKMLSLIPDEKLAIRAALSDSDRSDKGWDWLVRLRKIVGGKNAQEIGAKTLEGRRCKGWQVSDDSRTTTVWADEKTAELVRVEMVMKVGDVRTVMSEFKFNPRLDASLFSLDVPEGYGLLADTTAISAQDDATEGLLLLLRAWTGGNGGLFPDSLMDTNAWLAAAEKYDWSQEKISDEDTLKKLITQAYFSLGTHQNWVYRGKGVKRGDAKQVVFFRPSGDGKYQVIYGDLSVRKVDEKDLPPTPSPDPAAPSPEPATEKTPKNASPPTAGDEATQSLLVLLRAWADGNGGLFPDALTGMAATTSWFKAAAKYDWSKETRDESTLRKMIGQAFFSLNANDDWTYRGKGVKLGDAKTAVFWQPVGGGKYRVIYGDLSVHSSQTEPRP